MGGGGQGGFSIAGSKVFGKGGVMEGFAFLFGIIFFFVVLAIIFPGSETTSGEVISNLLAGIGAFMVNTFKIILIFFKFLLAAFGNVFILLLCLGFLAFVIYFCVEVGRQLKRN